MKVIDLLNPDRVSVDAVARSKKRALEIASELLVKGQEDTATRAVFSSLCAREKLGSTGFGRGVAIPHGRIADADIVSGAFMRLKDPVDFDSSDGLAVDLIFALAVPSECEERHLELLSQVAELFDDKELCDDLRKLDDYEAIMERLKAWQAQRISGSLS